MLQVPLVSYPLQLCNGGACYMMVPDSSAFVVDSYGVTTASKTHRFVVPADEPGSIERDIARLATAGRSSHGASRRFSRALVGVITAIIAAGVTLAILVASGAVKF